jgi:hypothetical protein
MKKFKLSLSVLALGLLLSCQNESVDSTIDQENVLSESAKLTLEHLKKKGYSSDDLKPDFRLGGFISDDVVFPFDLYQNLSKSKLLEQSKNQLYRLGVELGQSNSATYYIGSDFPEVYVEAMRWASLYWSISSPNIDIQRTSNRDEADIICGVYNDPNSSSQARAAYPNGSGNVGSYLRINTGVSASSSLRSRTVLMMHELGHNLGYLHANRSEGNNIPNTETPEFHQNNRCGSIMRSSVSSCNWQLDGVKNWSEYDRIAIEAVYKYE